MSETPARNTRLRARTPQPPPLPALQTAQSYAYGAQGKAELRSQIAPEGTSFAEAFASGRTAAEAPVATPVARKRKGRPAARQTIIEEAEEDDEPLAAESTAVEDRSATFIPGAAPYTAPAPRLIQQQQQRPPPPPLQNVEQADPWAVRIFMHTLPRWLRAIYGWYHRKAVKILTWILTFFLLVALARQIAQYTQWRPPIRVQLALPDWVQHHVFNEIPIRELTAAWDYQRLRFEATMKQELPAYNMPDIQWGINKWFQERIKALEAEVQLLKGNMGMLNETMEALHTMLPENLAVRMVDGKYEIPENFWDALADRLAGGENAKIWHGFWKTNEHQLRTMVTEVAEQQTRSEIKTVSRELFVHLIKENNDWLAQQHDETISKMQQELTEQMRTISASTAQDLLRQSPADQMARSQLDILVKANHIHNTHEAMRSVNFFSRGLGAIVDPYLTSPTKRRPQKNKAAVLYSYMPWIVPPKAPIVALERWDEAGDCWCAAVSYSKPGKAQITIIMPFSTYPDRLVVEHAPARGTPDISSAPRELEIFAEAPSKEHAHRIRNEIRHKFGDGRDYQCGTGLPAPNFVCVGKARYDIHSTNWVQSFPLFIDAMEMNFSTNKMTVRVVQNWGGEWTCLYRLRMTGTRRLDESGMGETVQLSD